MQLKAWGSTHVGMKRSINQDAFYIDEDLGLFIVADGMGGHKGGEVASVMAIESVKKVITKYKDEDRNESPRIILQQAYSFACNSIYDHGMQNPELKGMGTTMVLAFLQKGHLFIANVGDSRCYLQQGLKLWQLTEDHSLVYEQLREGLIKESDLDEVEGKNVITRSVGYEREVVCDVIEREIKDTEHFILCSDGLYGMLSDKRICEISLTCSPDQWPERMIYEANEAGGTDNTSVISISVVN